MFASEMSMEQYTSNNKASTYWSADFQNACCQNPKLSQCVLIRSYLKILIVSRIIFFELLVLRTQKKRQS